MPRRVTNVAEGDGLKLKIQQIKLDNKMEENYNWNLILAVSLPVAIIEAVLFYINLSNFWRVVALIAGLLVAGTIIYSKDKRKSNLFTALGIVILGALISRLLRNFGL